MVTDDTPFSCMLIAKHFILCNGETSFKMAKIQKYKSVKIISIEIAKKFSIRPQLTGVLK